MSLNQSGSLPDDVNDVSKNFSAKVYPNPATDLLFIELNDDHIHTVSLMDMSGKILSVYKTDNRKLSVPTMHLANGMYLLQFDNGSQKQTIRFLKQ